MTAMSKWTSFTLFGEALAKCGGSRPSIAEVHLCRYDFDSWREFSYLDKEDSKKGEE